MLTFKVAIARVNTLVPAEVRQAQTLGCSTRSKIEHLDTTLHPGGYHVAGFQETRIIGDVARSHANYMAYTAGYKEWSAWS